jgi:hypothetical protein
MKSREERAEKLIKAQKERLARESKGRGKGPLSRGPKAKTDAQRKQQCEVQYKAAKQQAVSVLIRRLQIQSEAMQAGVQVSGSEVAKQVKAREASRRALAKNSRASQFGLGEAPRYSGADLRATVSSELLEALLNTKIRERFTSSGSVSQGQMEKYFSEHKQAYGEPERRSIVFAMTKSQSVAAAVASGHLAGGLTAAAGKHGVTATPSTLGCQQAVAKGVSGSGLITAVCAAKVHVITGPVTAAAAAVKPSPSYYVFEVSSIVPAVPPSFANAKGRIKQLLAPRAQQQAMLRYTEEARAKLKAQTECAPGYVVPSCKEYVAPKPTTLSKAKPAAP